MEKHQLLLMHLLLLEDMLLPQHQEAMDQLQVVTHQPLCTIQQALVAMLVVFLLRLVCLPSLLQVLEFQLRLQPHQRIWAFQLQLLPLWEDLLGELGTPYLQLQMS